jgi:hypothetical protein
MIKIFKMKRFNILLALMILLIVSSCAPKVYFTTDLREKIEKANISLKDIQYYSDRKVILKRELESGKTQVQTGKVKFENGKYIHYIILKPNTPGVCKEIFTNKLTTQFENGQNRTLNFGKPKDGKDTDAYQIYANKWKINIGEIYYDGYTYYIQYPGSYSRLQIKKSVLNKINIEKRKMKGIRIE